MMVSESGSPSMAIGWNAGRAAGSAGVGRLVMRPDFSSWRLKSSSLIGVARDGGGCAGRDVAEGMAGHFGVQLATERCHLLGRQGIEGGEQLGEIALRHRVYLRL